MTIPSGMLMNPDDAGRPPDARWQRITDLADRGEPAKHKWDDGWIKRGLLPSQWDRRAVELHEDIKRAFDPKGLLNPGTKLARYPARSPATST